MNEDRYDNGDWACSRADLFTAHPESSVRKIRPQKIRGTGRGIGNSHTVWVGVQKNNQYNKKLKNLLNLLELKNLFFYSLKTKDFKLPFTSSSELRVEILYNKQGD